MFVAGAAVIVLLVLIVEMDALHGFFTMTNLTSSQWLVCAAVGSTILWVGELVKAVLRSRTRRRTRSRTMQPPRNTLIFRLLGLLSHWPRAGRCDHRVRAYRPALCWSYTRRPSSRSRAPTVGQCSVSRPSWDRGLHASDGPRGALPRVVAARLDVPGVSMPRSYWSVKKYGALSYTVSCRPSSALAAICGWCGALAQRSTRMCLPSRGWKASATSPAA